MALNSDVASDNFWNTRDIYLGEDWERSSYDVLGRVPRVVLGLHEEVGDGTLDVGATGGTGGRVGGAPAGYEGGRGPL